MSLTNTTQPSTPKEDWAARLRLRILATIVLPGLSVQGLEPNPTHPLDQADDTMWSPPPTATRGYPTIPTHLPRAEDAQETRRSTENFMVARTVLVACVSCGDVNIGQG